MEFVIGKVFADAALGFAKKHNVDMEDIDVVASHGQTMWHIPLPEGDQVKSTLQMMVGPDLSASARGQLTEQRTGIYRFESGNSTYGCLRLPCRRNCSRTVSSNEDSSTFVVLSWVYPQAWRAPGRLRRRTVVCASYQVESSAKHVGVIGDLPVLRVADTLNSGGIANFSWLPANQPSEVFEFDTGPG